MIKGLVFFLMGGFAIFQSHEASTQRRNLEPLFVKPPDFLEHAVFGYREVAAHTMWIRTIQDLDYCEKKSHKKTAGCLNQWAFHMMDKATDLLPNYRSIYSLGTVYLSIILDDQEGSGRLYEKAIANFPHDWHLSYKAAYYYIYERPNELKAAQLLKNAGLHGAPKWVFSLASRLYTKAGKAELGEAMAENLEKEGYDPEIVKKVRQRIKHP